MDNIDNSNTKGIVCSVIFIITIVLALIGNIILIVTVFSRRAMRSSLNYLIANLAMADVLLCLSSIFLFPINLLQIDWPLGSIGCKLTFLVSSTTVGVISTTLVLISILLFKILACSQTPWTKTEAISIAAGIWAINIFVNIGNWIFMRQEQFDRKICINEWSSKSKYYTVEAFYNSFSTLWQYFVPAVWLFIIYMIILFKGIKSYSLVGRALSDIEEHEINKKMGKIMLIVSLMHLLCWGALMTHSFYINISNKMLTTLDIHLLFAWMALVSTLCRPVIYIVMSAKFRSNLMDTILCR